VEDSSLDDFFLRRSFIFLLLYIIYIVEYLSITQETALQPKNRLDQALRFKAMYGRLGFSAADVGSFFR
jgi:hypothetical protein